MKQVIEITLSKDYVQSWGEFEGIREIISNGIDGQREFGCKLRITYNATQKKLYVANEGGKIPRETLLIGFTTKREKDNLIGKFGEGLKLGLLALLRCGKEVLIKNDDEVWRPVIEKSANFDAEVLKIRISKSRNPSGKLLVSIGGLDKETWDKYRQSFLFLYKRHGKALSTAHGRLLLDSRMRGRVYVRGCLVSEQDDLRYGYDLLDAEIDRDRKMVEQWSLEYKTSQIIGELLPRSRKLARQVYNALQGDFADVRRLHYNPQAIEVIMRRFTKTHGNAIPVSCEAEAREVEHFGRQGVVVSAALRAIATEKLGTFEHIKANLCAEKVKVITKLDNTEKTTLEAVINMIAQVHPEIKEKQIDVCEFGEDDTLGQYVHADGHIRVARRVLQDMAVTLQVLTHEFCHTLGGDGEKKFVFAVERVLARVAVANVKK